MSDVSNTVLNSARLRLRPFQSDDVDNLFELASDSDVMRYIGGGPETMEQVEAGLKRAIERWQTEGMSWWAVFDLKSNQFLGRCCLQKLHDLPEIEVGYAFHKKNWRKGFGTEAVGCLLDYGFKTFDFRSVVALTHLQNLPSQRLLERCGFDEEKVISLRNKQLRLYRITKEKHNQTLHSLTSS